MTRVPTDRAEAVLRRNDVPRYGYTRPAGEGLYPHQWNWDSAFAALGWATFDPPRAYAELRRLAGMQTEGGLIPHLAFSPRIEHYFPSADWWPPARSADGRRVSAISQPPVAATCLRLLFERHPDPGAARPLVAPLLRWHAWWLDERDPHGLGEPVVVHPWETGRDDAPEWDAALHAVPRLEVAAERRDTRWVGLDERPTDDDYAHYAWLVRAIDRDGGAQRALAAFGAFRVLDPGVSCALAAAARDLAAVAAQLGLEEEHEASERHAARVEAALAARAGDDGIAGAVDLVGGGETGAPGAGWALNVLRADLPGPGLDAIERACCGDEDALASPAGVRSWPRSDARYEPRRYWRGPVWANVTWLVALGLERHGRAGAAATLRERLAAAAEATGFREYLDGAAGFTWTAALSLWTRRASGG